MNKEFTCQQCGIKFYAESWEGRNPKYCSRTCMGKKHTEESKKTQYKMVCKKCKILFTTFNIDQIYCSTNCRATDTKPEKKIEKTCKVCDKRFISWTYRESVCCSRQCASTLAAGIPHPTARRPKSFIDRICQNCGKHFEIHKCMLERKDKPQGIFCSKECYSQVQSIRKRGENNPNYKGGKIDFRGPNWCSQARKARRLDCCQCQICDKRGKEDHERIDVHHINPYREFNGDWESANQLVNLISLCRHCHAKVECGKMELPQSRQLAAAEWFAGYVKSTVTISMTSQ